MIIRGDNNEQTKAFTKPLLNSTISSPYGMRYHPIKLVYKMHEGIDFQFTEPSSGAKYLESKLHRNKNRYALIIANRIKESQ